jgi:hypothetical protein
MLIPQGTTTEIVGVIARGATDPEIETETGGETATVERAASEMTVTAEIVGTATGTGTASHTTAVRVLPLAAVSDLETVATATAADATVTMTEIGVAAPPHASQVPARRPRQRQIAGETA